MPVDFREPAELLTVHGVATGSNGDQQQHEKVRSNVETRLAALDAPANGFPSFTSDIVRYEDINDDATFFFRRIIASLTGNRVAGWILAAAADLVGDVLLALEQDATYDLIKEEFKSAIARASATQPAKPVYLVAHSLGSFYALEVIDDLMKEGHFDSDDRADWPVHGFVSIGSPLGLSLFDRGTATLHSRKLVDAELTNNRVRFPWRNYWDSQDPIVTGNLLGFPQQSQFSVRFDRQLAKAKGWDIRDNPVNSETTVHVVAHSGYWKSPFVAQGIINLVLRNWPQGDAP